MIREVTILGGGSAGLLAALSLRRRLPDLPVRVIRSADIGVIGVGEGTTQIFPRYLFENLRLKPAQFYAEAQPTWKLGIRFLWGARPHFHYTFSSMIDARWEDLPKNNGYYCDEDFENLDVWASLMGQDKAFPRRPDGLPDFDGHQHVGFHIENKKLVDYLEARCRDFGAEIIDATVQRVETSERGVEALILEDGRVLTSDLFVDASGFRSELLGRALGVPFQPFTQTLFCDRAVIGGWPRTTEPIRSYTVAETMNHGWSWQIEHEGWINRGYVYSSAFVSDEEARAELVAKNPKVIEGGREPRIVRFRTGRYATMWKGNVVGIGNASGFVEPLEASALQCIIVQCRTLADLLLDTAGEPTATAIEMYNRFIGDLWDNVRDFLGVHYKFNGRLETPFWQAARNDTALGRATDLVRFYQENGPSSLGRTVLLDPNDPYGLEGYYALLVGQKVPFSHPWRPGQDERRIFDKHRKDILGEAKRGFDVASTLEAIRRPGWRWGG